MAVQELPIIRLARDVPGVGLIEYVETDKRRVYYLTPPGAKRRQQWPSVTTVLRETWPKPHLNRWYAKLGADAERHLAVAAARGKAVHTFVEAFLSGGDFIVPDDPDLAGYIQGAARFLTDYRPEPEAIELLVAHPELRYAGRLDVRAMVNGKRTILDFKTNPEGRVYAEAHIQLLAYAMADVACGAEPASQLLVVGISETGQLNVVPSRGTEALWRNLRASHDLIKALEKQVGNDDLLRKEAAA